MPITIFDPITGAPFGIGFQFHVQTNLIGPFQPGTKWRITLQTQNEVGLGFLDYPLGSVQHEIADIFGRDPATNTYKAIQPQASFSQGVAGRVLVQLNDPVGAQIESASTAITQDFQSPVPWLLTQQTTGQGFTQDDRLQLQAINQATVFDLPTFIGVGQQLVAGLSGLVESPPESQLCRVDVQDVLSSKTLTRPGGPWGLNAYGLYYEVLTFPAGMTVQLGAAPEYRERLVQFVVRANDAQGNEYRRAVFDSRWDHAIFRWPGPRNNALDVTLSPGVTIRMWWLVWCPLG